MLEYLLQCLKTSDVMARHFLVKERSFTDGKKGFVRMHGKKKLLNFESKRSGCWLILGPLPLVVQ